MWIITLTILISSAFAKTIQPYTEIIDSELLTQTHEIRQRELNTWSSITSCSLCEQDSSWTWLNSTCAENTINSISRETYTQSSDYAYCMNAVSSGRITLSDLPDRTLEVGFYSNASTGQLWEWEARIDDKFTTRVILSRNVNSNEDLNLYLFTSPFTGTLYTNRGLTDWSTTTYTIEMDNVEFLRLRAKLYSATIFNTFNARIQEVEKENDSTLIGVLLIIGLVLIFSWTVCACFCIITTHYRMKYQQHTERQRERLRIQRLINSRFERVTKTMKNMKSGKYIDLKTKYGQNSCVVCLEDFEPDSSIHVTNECQHAFHTSCLKEWYQSIDPTKDLACPHCNTVNTNENNPIQNEQLEMRSVNDEVLEENKAEEHKVEELKNNSTSQVTMINEEIRRFQSMRREVQN